MLLFGNCLPLPMKKTTPVRVIIFIVYLGKTFMSPEGVIRSVVTAAIIFRLIANLFTEKCVKFSKAVNRDAPLNKL